MRKLLPGLALAAGILLAPSGFAQGADLDCTRDAAQCDAACDGDRAWGLFKGRKFKDCAARCEAQLARQCRTRGDGLDTTQAGGRKGDKVHPEGKQYGYEKNADKVRGQHGAAVSAAQRRDGELHGEGAVAEAAVAIEAAAAGPLEAELDEKAGQPDKDDMEAVRDKARKAGKDPQKGREKARKD